MNDHKHVAGSVGGPGECGVECACGVAFDGFDTMAEAREQLDLHIADAGQEAERQRTLSNLATAVRDRRTFLGLTQKDVQERGGPSIATLRTIENSRAENLYGMTVFRLDGVLGWPSGTAMKLLRGELSEPPSASIDDAAGSLRPDPRRRATQTNDSVLNRLVSASVAAGRMRVLSGGVS